MRYVFLRFPHFADKAVTLSYDDGVKWDRNLVEIMSKNGLKGTFNINMGLLAKEPGGGKLTAEEAITLYTSTGNEVAVHGYKHLSLNEVDPAMATDDIITDRKALEKMLRKPVKGMAYANGHYSDNVVEILKNCGIVYARTTVSTERFDLPNDWLRLPSTCHHDNPRLMELAHKFMEEEALGYFWSKRPKLFYLWGHSYEFNDNNNWYVMEEFASYIGNRPETEIWYATNMEIYDYVKAYEALQFAADGSFVYNPTMTELFINYMGREYVLPCGKVVDITT